MATKKAASEEAAQDDSYAIVYFFELIAFLCLFAFN